MHVEKPKQLFLESSGPGEVLAKHITPDADIEILNPELHIATLSKDATLSMVMDVELGRGYLTAERHAQAVVDPQVIPLDAAFSPIRKVVFQVENTRVGRSTDYDRLILEVQTNGSIHPEDAEVGGEFESQCG